jgi:uncharacterized membrane protein (DUF4010 family)
VIVAVGFICVALLVTKGNFARMEKGEAEPGQATEFTALVMYGIGAWVVIGSMPVAVVLAGVVALLLHLREPLHDFAGSSAAMLASMERPSEKRFR